MSQAVNAIEISGVSKSFGSNRVVDSISFNVGPGEIFGLIGPNGAGKTTTIRMMMDIIRPDAGRIAVLGEGINEQTKNRIGYLPEERGLYRKLSVLQSLCYLGSLKGVDPRQVQARATALLERAGMAAVRKRKIEELSRGMGQIVQFLAAIVHDPSLLVLDEPFANLDPVNTELLKEIVFELRQQGKAIILSTHRMNEVEALCDRIFMINQGHGVLYGKLSEIKARYRNNSVLAKYEGDFSNIKGISGRKDHETYAELILDEATSPQDILEQMVSQGIRVTRFEVSTPPLHDIFLSVVGENQ